MHEDFAALSRDVYQEAVFGDRPKAVQRLRRYIAGLTSPADLARAYELLLPHEEAEARLAAGLSDYSSDHLDEWPFIFATESVGAYLDAVGRWVAISPTALPAVTARAFAALLEGRWAGVDGCLGEVRYFIPPRLAGTHFEDWGDYDHARFLRDLPPVRQVGVGDNGTGHKYHSARRVFIGCDPVYFQLYGVTLAKSLRATNACPHFHLFDTDGALEYKTLNAEYRGDFTMDCEFVGLPTDVAKYYYAAIRLVRMAELCRDGIPTVMLDADTVCSASLNPLFARLENHDAVLCRMPGRLPFHTQINASVVGIAPRGVPYLTRVAAYIGQCFTEKNIFWCMDQTALHCVLRMMQPDVDAVACGPGVYDGTLNAAVCPRKVQQENPHYNRLQDLLGTINGDRGHGSDIRAGQHDGVAS